MNNFHWETAIPEKHHAHNFDVRKVRALPGACMCHPAILPLQ